MTTYELKSWFENHKSILEREYQKDLDRIANTLDEPIPKFIKDGDEINDNNNDN